MSYLKLQDYTLAQTLLRELSSDKSIGYYSLTARARLSTIPKDSKNQLANDIGSGDRSIASEPLLELMDESAPKLVTEENESEETLAAEIESPTPPTEEEIEAATEIEENPVEFKDPKLRVYFQRGQSFTRIGLLEKARWELYEIERKTSNKDYLTLLMKAYEEAESHHRSSAIGQIYFSSNMQRYEMQNIKYLWEHTYPRAYSEHVEKYATEFSVPNSFIWSIMRAESLYRPFVVSPVGALGLMQIMPNTGLQVSKLLGESGFQKKRLRDPETNVKLGSRYLQRLIKMFNGSYPLAAAAYNAGPHRVESWLSNFGNLELDEFIEHIPFVETRNYVKKVVRYKNVYSKLYNKTPDNDDLLAQDLPITLKGAPAMRESWEQL
jgi:soluble lytic murein transglycosylase